ncbi:hypothetical protein ACQKWADRAFT_255496 [Trichoderma austrokoningii]
MQRKHALLLSSFPCAMLLILAEIYSPATGCEDSEQIFEAKTPYKVTREFSKTWHNCKLRRPLLLSFFLSFLKMESIRVHYSNSKHDRPYK